MLRLTIATAYDFTPRGKRRARVVPTSRGGSILRFYVGGRRFRQLAPTPANLILAREWAANEGAADNRPQPWESFQ